MTILVAGHTGLVGSAVFELLKSKNEVVVGINSKVVNLLDRKETFAYVMDLKPKLIIDAAAIVGGIVSNSSYPVEFLSKNVQIQCNLMDAAHAGDVERFVFLGSSCIYPRDCKQPIREEYLLTGPLEITNSAYAIAKISGIELIKAYRNQYGRRWISLMPTNMYGPRDNFDLETSHVLPAMIKRFVDARNSGVSEVVLWGTGKPRREFMHVRDCAEAIIVAAEKYDSSTHLNLGVGEDISIRDLALLIANLTGFQGTVQWDSTKPDGTPRKLLEVSRLKSLGWSPKIALEVGIKETIDWFESHYT